MNKLSSIIKDFYSFKSNELFMLRKKLKKSQSQMAKFLGVNHGSYVSHWEAGRREIPKHIALLCNFIKNFIEMEKK